MGDLLVIIVLVVVLGGGLFVITYNALTAAQTRVVQGWSGIAVQLKRRHDLVPNLVKAVRAALAHEEAMLATVTESRERAMAALAGGDAGDIARQEAALGGALHRLVAFSESYPDLKGNGSIQIFQRQLEETEDQIAAARRIYNGNVQDFNRRVLGIPGNLVAPLMGLRPANSFELDAGEASAVQKVPDASL